MEQPASLLSLYYFPPVNWFAALANAPAVHLEQHEHYVKGSYRNRCHIAAVNGVQRLTIPLRKGKNQQQPIREVRIAYDEPWQMQHWRAICSAYGNSPFFEHYAGLFEPYFKAEKYELLWDWNYDLLMVSMKILKLKMPIFLTEKYEHQPEQLLDLRSEFHPKELIQSSDYEPIRYPQVFEDRLGFLENLSVLDLIFCAGRINI
ncbi:MAG: WbqC family protein [Saprospiraceae bacterium]|nr:WbqC family protein [Saprospiraceae bacterium]